MELVSLLSGIKSFIRTMMKLDLIEIFLNELEEANIDYVHLEE